MPAANHTSDSRQYGCLIKAPFSGKTYAMLEDTTEPTLLAALQTAYAFYRDGSEPLAVFSVDMDNGAMQQHYNAAQLECWCRDCAKAQEAADRSDEIHGSYNQQHALRMRDVVGA